VITIGDRFLKVLTGAKHRTLIGQVYLRVCLTKQKQKTSIDFKQNVKMAIDTVEIVPMGGEWSRSGGGQILDNLGALYPQQHSPMFIPGQPGQEGKGSAIGKAIGTAAGIVAAPFTGGASLGAIPFLSGAGGTIGGAF
jgi:hypothetical protein